MFSHLSKVNKLVVANVLKTMAVPPWAVMHLSGMQNFFCIIITELNVTFNNEYYLTIVSMTVVAARCTGFKTAEHNLIILIFEVAGMKQTFATLETFDVFRFNFIEIYNHN